MGYRRIVRMDGAKVHRVMDENTGTRFDLWELSFEPEQTLRDWFVHWAKVVAVALVISLAVAGRLPDLGEGTDCDTNTFGQQMCADDVPYP